MLLCHEEKYSVLQISLSCFISFGLLFAIRQFQEDELTALNGARCIRSPRHCTLHLWYFTSSCHPAPAALSLMSLLVCVYHVNQMTTMGPICVRYQDNWLWYSWHSPALQHRKASHRACLGHEPPGIYHMLRPHNDQPCNSPTPRQLGHPTERIPFHQLRVWGRGRSGDMEPVAGGSSSCQRCCRWHRRVSWAHFLTPALRPQAPQRSKIL